MIAALALALAPLAVPPVPPGPPVQRAREDRLQLARVELVGPLEEARFDLGAMGVTRVLGPLAEGERRALQVPLPAWGDPRGAEPEVEVDGEGSARFVAWDDAANEGLARRWLEVPAGLRARPLPVPPALDRRRPPETAVLLVAALFLIGLALRKRPRAGYALGVAGAGALLLLAHPVLEPDEGVHVQEGDGSGRWISVFIERSELGLRFDELALRVECLPPRARLRWTVGLDPDRAWSASASRAVLFALAESRPSGQLHPARNDLHDLLEVWIREAGAAEWTGHPAWPRGSGLRASTGPADPPGWLNPALPMGTGVLIGRAQPLLRREGDWIRLVGFSPP